MTGREVAWRVLALELRASSEQEKGSGDRVPSYVVSPLGGRMNRVLVVGTLTPPEPAGGDGQSNFWRSRLTDPTGTLPVSAGNFQPRAQAELRRLTAPTPALVIGKANLFRGTTGGWVATVRAESVRPVDPAEYSAALAEAASQTLVRLRLVARLRSPPSPSDAELTREGVPPAWVRGARASIARYAAWDPAPYREAVRAVVGSLGTPTPVAPTPGPAAPTPVPGTAPRPTVTVTHLAPPAPRPPPTGQVRALEGTLLDLLDGLAERSADGYADMDDLTELAVQHGIGTERMEELLNHLEESGAVEEPIVGKFRRTGEAASE